MKRIAAILIVVLFSFNLWSPEARAMGRLPMVSGWVLINNGATATNSPDVVLTLTARSYSGSPVTLVKISNTPVDWETVPSLPYTTSKNWTLLSGDGRKDIYVRFGDSIGNWSPVPVITSGTITLDTTPPTSSVAGAAFTNTPDVTLSLAATDTGSGMGAGAQMQFSNDGTTWSAAEDYAPTKAWALLSGEGLKTVSVKVKDAVGNWSAASSAQITLDTTAPTGSIVINSPTAVYVPAFVVRLRIYATDVLSREIKMRLSRDDVSWSGWSSYDEDERHIVMLDAVDGLKTFYVQFMDMAGNVSSTYSDTIIKDTTPPVGTISINSVDGHTATTTVTLSLSATDATSGVSQMQFSNDGTSWSAEESYATTKSWDLLPGRGTRTVYVIFIDLAGRMSDPVSATVYLDAPVAQYEFDFNFEDSSGAGNNGTPNGDMNFNLTNGKPFAGFDGIDDYITVPNSASLNLGAMTVSYWVKPNYKYYAGKEYAVINKGTSGSKEYYLAMFGQTPGFGIVPGLGSSPALNAPTNLVAEYGGNVGGEEIVYLTWEDNSSNEDGFTVEIRDHSDVQVSLTNVPAGTTSFKASFAPGETVYNIKVWAYQGVVNSEFITTQVRLDGTDPVIPPAAAMDGWIPRDNKWHQVAQTRSATGVNKYYIDGQLIYTAQGTVPTPGTEPLLIGAVNPPTEVPSSVSRAGGVATITWSSVAGQRYGVQYKESASDVVWLNCFPDIVFASGSTASMTNRDPYGLRVYRVLRPDDQAMAGGIDDVVIYNTAFPDADIENLYNEQREQFQEISHFISTEYFADLPEPQLSQATDELEQLSLMYKSAWNPGLLPEAITTSPEADSYLGLRWERQRQFYIDQLRIMERYNVLHGRTADEIIAEWDPVWESQRANHAWFMDLSAQAAASISQETQALITEIQQSTNSAETQVQPLGPAGIQLCSTPGATCYGPARSYQFLSPAFPFIYIPFYCPTHDPACEEILRAVYTQMQLFTVQWIGVCDGVACSGWYEYWELKHTENRSGREIAKFDFLEFDGSSITICDYEIAPQITTDSLTFAMVPFVISPYSSPSYQTYANVPNQLAWGLPFEHWADTVTLISIDHRKALYDYWNMGFGGPGGIDLDILEKGVKSPPRPLDAEYLIGDLYPGGEIRIMLFMHNVPLNYRSLIPAWGQRAANLVGAIVGPLQLKVGAGWTFSFDNPISSKFAILGQAPGQAPVPGWIREDPRAKSAFFCVLERAF